MKKKATVPAKLEPPPPISEDPNRFGSTSQKRVHIVLPNDFVTLLEKLSPYAPSLAEIIRNALRIYIMLCEAKENGEHVFLSTASYLKVPEGSADTVKEIKLL